ncbi:MaoC family dehydratase N-terminal domain-containing protein [Catenulispora rubra]|uniref:MaoC family dehydratase N-terminal domain-containing protein n=1 Tax=Catenulispora rubra TaxID=280293 RepID=UPI00189248FD|nr:MaoC family dehydratase N-terminal domain-containing protein [Catenulispora rubra]
MALDVGFIGRTYPPTAVYEVGREKIREFADAIGDPNPVYRDPAVAQDLGHRDVLAPPTFPIAITWPAATVIIEDPDLGLDFSRVLHGEQRFVHNRPIYADDQLTATVTIEDITERMGQGFLSTRTELNTVDGELVVTGFSKLVVVGAGGGEGEQA